MSGEHVRIAVDRGVCESHGQCVHTAPEVFDLDDDGAVVHPDGVPESDRPSVEAAAAACPVRAITVG